MAKAEWIEFSTSVIEKSELSKSYQTAYEFFRSLFGGITTEGITTISGDVTVKTFDNPERSTNLRLALRINPEDLVIGLSAYVGLGAHREEVYARLLREPSRMSEQDLIDVKEDTIFQHLYFQLQNTAENRDSFTQIPN